MGSLRFSSPSQRFPKDGHRHFHREQKSAFPSHLDTEVKSKDRALTNHPPPRLPHPLSPRSLPPLPSSSRPRIRPRPGSPSRILRTSFPTSSTSAGSQQTRLTRRPLPRLLPFPPLPRSPRLSPPLFSRLSRPSRPFDDSHLPLPPSPSPLRPRISTLRHAPTRTSPSHRCR